MISIQNLCFDYPGTHALDNITCNIPQGSITALVGPNGAGKTTLMRSMSALATPVSGSIKIDDIDTSQNPRKIHQICSYLSDFFGLYDNLTVDQCLQYAAWTHNCSQDNIQNLVSKVISELELSPHQHKKAGTLSRGLRQRLAIAQTIIHRPQYVLLDEPASGLDPDARVHLSQLLLRLRDEGLTIVVSSHILAELEDYSTHMMILKNGKLIEFTEVGSQQTTQKLFVLTLANTANIKEVNSFLDQEPYITLIQHKDFVFTIECDTQACPPHELLQKFFQLGFPVESFQAKKSSLQEHYMDITHQSNENKDA